MLVKGRYFIVGCPRSGTTLLQSLLAAHSSVKSFPESHFFCNLFGDHEPKRKILRIASRRIRPRMQEFLSEAGVKEHGQYLPENLIFTSQYTKAFWALLDRLCIEARKEIWIEKTPPHLHYVDYIERKIPNARFIHIVRNGADVITSIYELRNRFPNIWDGENSSLSKCVDRWIGDIEITKRNMEKTNHSLVRYEDLVFDTERVLREICHFVEISFERKMLTDYSSQVREVSLERETWKQSVKEGIRNRQDHKFKRLLDVEQQNYVYERIKGWNLDELFPSSGSG